MCSIDIVVTVIEDKSMYTEQPKECKFGKNEIL